MPRGSDARAPAKAPRFEARGVSDNPIIQEVLRQGYEKVAELRREREGITLEQEAERLSSDLTGFVRAAWHAVWPNEPYVHGRHIDAICDYLSAVSAGETRYLQIWVPPGSSKSSLVSIMWPAWEWTSQPHLRHLSASYGTALATGFAVKSRDLIRSSWFQARWPNVQIKRDQDAKQSYANTAGGERFATSPGGTGTGKHAHRIIIDDAMNAQEIASEASLAAVREWHDGTIALRHIPGGGTAEVIIQQRLSERDLAGHVLEIAGSTWEVLCLPEQYEPAHPFAWRGDWRKEEGELLWPEVVDLPEHDRRAANLGSHKAAGQLQQRPSAREGAILKRSAWNYFPARWLEDDGRHYLPKFTAIVQSWDTAFKDRTASDFVAGGMWGRIGADIYLLDLRVERLSLSKTKDAMRAMNDSAQRHWPGLPTRVLIEKSANGIEIIEELKREIRGVIPVVASTSKVARAEAAEPALESGNVFIPGMAAPENPSGYNEAMTPAFAQALVEECAVFPNGQHDDQVDQFTQVVNWTRGNMSAPAKVMRSTVRIDATRQWASHRDSNVSAF